MSDAIVWDNHACMPLRPGDTSFLPQLERVRAAGVDVVVLNVSFDLAPPGQAFEVLATYRRWITRHPDRYALANTVADIEAARAADKLSVLFDIEGANAVAAHPGMVEIFYRLGVRWMLLAYNRNNAFGGGCLDGDTGLTARGREIIDEMERVGMVLCCSHAGHRTALDAMEYSRRPVIFSHSNPSAVHPHVRNIPDELLRACAATGGVVNLAGVGVFLGKGPDGLGDNSTEALIRHIDYVVTLIGARHVGLGLDYAFDVAELEDFVRRNPSGFPPGLQVARSYRQIEPERIPAIAHRLRQLGYSEADVTGIMGENNLRVAREVWK